MTMKLGSIILLLAILVIPTFAFGNQIVQNERITATVLESGNWQLTDLKVNTTWKGVWLSGHLMKVVGSDGSCFIMGENEHGLVQLDCHDLKQLSILFSYQK